MNKYVLQQSVPVEVRHYIGLHVVHGSSLLGLVNRECFQWLPIVVKLRQDDSVITCDQRTRRVTIILKQDKTRLKTVKGPVALFPIIDAFFQYAELKQDLTFVSGFSLFKTFLIVLFRMLDCAAKNEKWTRFFKKINGNMFLLCRG